MKVFHSLAQQMSERELQEAIRKLCDALGLLCYHTYDSRKSPEGFPDLVICSRLGVIYAELKSEKGKLSASQQTWKEALERAGETYYLWRPQHWLSGDIERILRGRKP